MCRCRACDALLDKYEGQWNDELKTHDDMCYICKGIILDAEREEAMSVYVEDTFDDIIIKPIDSGGTDG